MLGNLPAELRALDKNIMVYGMIPPGHDFRDCSDCLVHDLKQLQDGVEMEVAGEGVCLVQASIGVITGDYPQGTCSCQHCSNVLPRR